MRAIKNSIASLLFCCVVAMLPAQSSDSNLFHEAMTLHQIRTDYGQFCKSIGAASSAALVPSPSADYAGLHPHVKSCVDNIASFRTTGTTSAPSGSFNNSFNSPGVNSGNVSPVDSPQLNRIRAKVIAEWHYAEAFVLGKDNAVEPNAVLNTSNPALTENFPSSFTYLDDIAGQVSGTGPGAAMQTSGAFDALAGGIPEAAIIQGIVDWAIARAKEELLQSFLQGWLDDLEGNRVLQIAFPNTLSLLSTSDLTTIFSQGDTWKAAFSQDLDALPVNLPQIVAAILDELPRKLSTSTEREIVGGVNVASQLYVQLDRNQNNFKDAVSLISQSLMRQTDTLAYSERAMIGAEVLLGAVTTVKKNLPATISTEQILRLGATELCDFWNLIYLRDKNELQRALNISHPDSLYAQVSRKLSELQLILAKTADIVENVHSILNVGKSANANAGGITGTGSTTAPSKATISFEQANAYYELIFELLDNSLALASLVDVPTGDVARILDDVVHPIGENIMDIAQGVSTRQYGQVVNAGIKLLRTLSDQLVRDPDVRTALNTAASLASLAKDFRLSLKNKTGSGGELKKQVSDLLTAWLKEHEGAIDAKLKELVKASLQKVNSFSETDLKAVQSFLQSELKALEKDLEKYIESLDLGEGIDQLAAFFNKYGTLMVNIITASSSDEVKEALEEAAAPTGSYMVKQTSTSSITLSFFPGLAFGHEFPKAGRNVVASGADTLGYSGGNYLGATLPIGLEMAFGVKSKVLGAVGFFVQAADLGAVLSYRLTSPGDSVQVTSDIGFKQVLSPGLGVVLHVAKAPIVLGGRVSYAPELRSVSDGNATYGLNMLQVNGFVAVDLSVFQIFASRKKIATDSKTYGDR